MYLYSFIYLVSSSTSILTSILWPQMPLPASAISSLFWQQLLLLSRFSHVQLCATPEMAAHQAPPYPGFSRQECWSGLPFPSPMHESEKWKWSRSVVSDSSDPMDCSLPGSSVHGIFQAKVLEWGAIAFSVMEKRCTKKTVPKTTVFEIKI